MKGLVQSVLFATAVLAPSVAHAAIVFDNKSSGTITDNTTLTISHTIGSGSDRLLVVYAAVEETTGLADITGVTYNGVSMTKAVDNEVGHGAIDSWRFA